MIPRECKRLAEVDFPIAVVSKHSAREKSIRHGHPSTLHLWWARRPLAACRGVERDNPAAEGRARQAGGEPFEEKMQRLVAQLREQQAEAAKLDAAVAANLKELGFL